MGVALAIVTIAVGAAVHHGPISDQESTLLATVLGAAVGAIATYLGVRVSGPPAGPPGAGGDEDGAGSSRGQ